LFLNFNGTEATAVTSLIFARKAAQEPAHTINIDRPFFFVIQDNQTGAILFMGSVAKPGEK
jgi:serine protease inhibitor